MGSVQVFRNLNRTDLLFSTYSAKIRQFNNTFYFHEKGAVLAGITWPTIEICYPKFISP